MRYILSILGGERTRQRRQALLLAGVSNELLEQLVDEDTVKTNKTTREASEQEPIPIRCLRK